MRISGFLNLFIVFSAIAALSACGAADSAKPGIADSVVGSEGVVNGTVEKKGSVFANSTVALRSKKDGEIFCSATVLSSRQLLTAAHCIESYDEQGQIEAVFDVNADAASSESIPVARILVHGEYSPFSKEDLCPFGACEKLSSVQIAGSHRAADLAILLLKADVPAGYRPVPLASSAEKASSLKNGLAAGYGASSFGKKTSQIKGAGKLRSMQSSLSYLPAPAKFLFKATKQGVCFGDSGGPLFVKSGSGWIQAGVASHLSDLSAKGPCGSGGATYTAVGAYADWIRQAQAKILAQKDFLSAPWRNIRTDGADVLSGGGDWFNSFVQSIDVTCEAPSVQLKGHVEIYPYFKGEGKFIGNPRTGTLFATVEYSGQGFNFSLREPGVNEEAQVLLEMQDIESVWKKTQGDRAKAYAAALNGGAHGLFIRQNDMLVSLNPYDRGPFKVLKATGTSIELEATDADLVLSDLKPMQKKQDARTLFQGRAKCSMSFRMLSHR